MDFEKFLGVLLSMFENCNLIFETFEMEKFFKMLN